MNIFFDFDGTLIDSRNRLYNLFQHLVLESALSFDEYWDLKKNKYAHHEILRNNFKYSLSQISNFQKLWMDSIEKPDWLKFDVPFDNMTDYLLRLSLRNKLYLVTARQSKEIVMNQLELLSWSEIFEEVFVTCQKTEKANLIKNAVRFSSDDWFVGDTGKDVETGKSLGMNTIAVLSGFLCEDKLREYEPDIIADFVTQIDFEDIQGEKLSDYKKPFKIKT